MIQNPAILSLKKGQLSIENDSGIHSIPLEDITALLLESPQISLSSALLSACQTHGVAVIFCDDKHMPNGLSLPFMNHTRQSRVAHIQISLTQANKDRLWQCIIQQKIINQADCLLACGNIEGSNHLNAIATQIETGDPQNREAQAARYYWPRLMGANFRRNRQDAPEDDILNIALNYGYAIMRACMARALVGYGLIPCFGVHHCNDLNAYNLADDVMEMLRPFVDLRVIQMFKDDPEQGEFTKTHRQILAGLGNEFCFIQGRTHNISTTCDKIAASLVNAMEQKSAALLECPSFIKDQK
jgi:CRISPR-associated protein Cas1